MSFIYPLGLIGLIGVPILIIIYIIKTKYTEQIIPSTYLWNLSEKFLNKKKQVKTVNGLISLILQILIVITVSLLIAHPVITLPNKAKEYCFILDASGSMNMEVSGVSKMELGKDRIEEIIENSVDGSIYTLIYAGSDARVIYEKLDNKEKAVELLDKVTPSGVTSSYNGILKYVQEYFNENPSLVTYLVTDKDYDVENINLINVSNNEENYALLDTKYVIDGNKLKITGNVISYQSDQTINLEIYINDELVNEDSISVQKAEKTAFSYISDAINFNTIKIEIKNTDGLSLDNISVIYNIEKSTEYSTLIVSDRPFYLYSALKTMGNTTIQIVSTENYDENVKGYDLYIFDSFSPTVLPNDGTIWLFGISDSINNSGFSVQDVVENIDGMCLTYPKNSTTTFKTLTEDLTKEDIYVSKYVKYGLYRNFTILLTYEGNPVVFTGLTDEGCREVVFAFDLHDSNFALLMDYLVLIKNLLDYSFPTILDESTYVCGDTALINIIPNVDSIRVDTPLGNVKYLDINSESIDLELTEAGIYTLTVVMGDDVKEYLIFSSLPEDESNPTIDGITLALQGEAKDEYRDGIYDKLIILFVILTVIFMADWVVYCYDQYQLR